MKSNISKLTLVTDIILLDIVGYSKRNNREQLNIILIITSQLKSLLGVLAGVGSVLNDSLKGNKLIIGFIPTGDGSYIILNPLYSGYGLLLALGIRNYLFGITKRDPNIYDGVRVAVHQGTIFPFVDLADGLNYGGDGMNDCARLFGANKAKDWDNNFTDENFVICSEGIHDYFTEIVSPSLGKDYLENLLKLKFSNNILFNDKHDKQHSIYIAEMNRHICLNPFKPIAQFNGEEKLIFNALSMKDIDFFDKSLDEITEKLKKIK